MGTPETTPSNSEEIKREKEIAAALEQLSSEQREQLNYAIVVARGELLQKVFESLDLPERVKSVLADLPSNPKTRLRVLSQK